MSNLIKNQYVNVQQGEAVIIDHSGDNGGFTSFSEDNRFKSIAELEVEKGLKKYGNIDMADIISDAPEGGNSGEFEQFNSGNLTNISEDDYLEDGIGFDHDNMSDSDNAENQEDDLEAASEKAERIVNEARELAEQIKNEAMEASEQLKATAYEEAKNRGYSDGMSQAEDELRAREQQLIEMDKQSKEELSQCINTIEQKYVQIVISLVEKLTGKAIENSPDIVLHLIKCAARDMGDARDFKIRVSNEELPQIEPMKDGIVDALGGECSVEIIGDSGVESGQCIVETDNQIVDCGIKTQLEMLQRDLLLLGGF